ncbi:MAG: hypothetical protein AAGG01_12925, partial [Planctomycetota bacterium]
MSAHRTAEEQRCRRIRNKRPGPTTQERGSALLGVIPLAILMMSLMMAFVGISVDTSRGNLADMTTFRTDVAAQGVASLAIAEIWGDFADVDRGSADLWEFQAHMAAMGLKDQSKAAAPEKSNYLSRVDLPKNARDAFELDGVEITRLEVFRMDQWDSTQIVVEVDAVSRRGAEGSSGEHRSSLQEIFTVAPPPWEGLNFALLANNINCLTCHTTIDNADRFYNQDPALYGSFDPVQVGSIESIHFRHNPASKVAGVVLVGEDALVGNGDNVSDWSRFNLKGASRSGNSLLQDRFGNLDYDDLRVFDGESNGDTANIYLDFFNKGENTGYELPETFPSPFPDNGGLDPVTGEQRRDLAGNRVIDDSEFYAKTAGADGTIGGGSISVIPHGQKVQSVNDLSRMRSGTDSSVSNVVDGNVYLSGTQENPLILDGNVAFDGDVIISGVVKGVGTIQARGNVYVSGDILYADATSYARTFGTAADGTPNSLAIAAGGNIVMGDSGRPRWGRGNRTTGEPGTSFNF